MHRAEWLDALDHLDGAIALCKAEAPAAIPGLRDQRRQVWAQLKDDPCARCPHRRRYTHCNGLCPGRNDDGSEDGSAEGR